jgi:hypothetical protein
MSDIVDRLRAMAGPIVPNVCTEAADEIERLIAERDEARREVCNMMHSTGFLAGDYANSREWDCFKEDGK